MNRIIIIVIILFICSCGTTKKITQTETHSKTNIETSLLDTSKRISSWELVVSSLVNTIDLSKIKITTFYPEKDSSGEQLVKEIVLIDKNIFVTESKFEEELKTENENKGLTIDNVFSVESNSNYKATNESKSNPLNLYIILIFGVGLAFFLALKIILK